MNDSKIPVRYAKAFFELVSEKKVLENAYKDMLLIQELVSMAEMKDLILSPVVSKAAKSNSFAAILDKKIDKITQSFIQLVFDKGRENYLASITRNFITLYKKHNNIKSVEVTTAVEINDATKKEFEKQIVKTFDANIDIVSKVNPELIGGFVVQIDDKLFDASVKRQLKNIKHTLLTEKL